MVGVRGLGTNRFPASTFPLDDGQRAATLPVAALRERVIPAQWRKVIQMIFGALESRSSGNPPIKPD